MGPPRATVGPLGRPALEFQANLTTQLPELTPGPLEASQVSSHGIQNQRDRPWAARQKILPKQDKDEKNKRGAWSQEDISAP